MDRHRTDAAPDPDSDPDWRQNDADPHADPTSSCTQVDKPEYFFIIFSCGISSLLRFIFLTSVKYAIIFSIFHRILEFSGKKVKFINFLTCLIKI